MFGDDGLPRVACINTERLNNLRQELLQKEVFPTKYELRRLKHPYHECVLQELEENDHFEAASFLRHLLEENQRLMMMDDYGIVKSIIEHPEVIDALKKTFIEAENAVNKRDILGSSCAMSRGAGRLLGACGAAGLLGWEWLGRRLHLSALGLARKTAVDGGHLRAQCHYEYALFLYKNFPHKVNETIKEHLILARSMSAGMLNWLILDKNIGSMTELYSVVNFLLADLYLRMSKEDSNGSEEKAENYCSLAVQRSKDSQNEEKHAEALAEMGKIQMTAKKYRHAIGYFTDSLNIYNKCANEEGICGRLIDLARAYQKSGDSGSAEAQVSSLMARSSASAWRGRALRVRAELLLMRDMGKEAAHALQEAFNCLYGKREKGELSESKVNAGRKITDTSESVTANLLPSSVNFHFQRISDKTESVSWNERSLSLMMKKKNIEEINELKDRILNQPGKVGFLVSQRPRKDVKKESEINMSETKSVKEVLDSVGRSGSDQRSHFSAGASDSKRKSNKQASSIRWKAMLKKKKRMCDPISPDLSDEDFYEYGGSKYEDVDLEELDTLRCLHGYAKGQELMREYFDAIQCADEDESVRNKIIEWKLNKKPFWEDDWSENVQQTENFEAEDVPK